MNTAKALAEEGWPVEASRACRRRLVDLDDLAARVRDDTALVAVMLANNETGVVQPVADVVRIAHARGALVHCDAVQAAGKDPVDVRAHSTWTPARLSAPQDLRAEGRGRPLRQARDAPEGVRGTGRLAGAQPPRRAPENVAGIVGLGRGGGARARGAGRPVARGWPACATASRQRAARDPRRPAQRRRSPRPQHRPTSPSRGSRPRACSWPSTLPGSRYPPGRPARPARWSPRTSSGRMGLAHGARAQAIAELLSGPRDDGGTESIRAADMVAVGRRETAPWPRRSRWGQPTWPGTPAR